MTTYKCLPIVIPKECVKNNLKRNEKPIREFFECELDKIKLRQIEELKIKIKEFGKLNRASSELCEELVKKICEYQLGGK